MSSLFKGMLKNETITRAYTITMLLSQVHEQLLYYYHKSIFNYYITITCAYTITTLQSQVYIQLLYYYHKYIRY